MPDADIQLMAALGRLGLALALGSAIGFERQWHQKMAGLRTNALVALGSCGFVVFSGMVGQGDPTRVAAQVVSGIGFLGAGVILREGANVHGLNTAATLWCSAMIGTFVGGGFWAPSASAAGFVIITNLLLRPLVRHLNSRTLTARGRRDTLHRRDYMQGGRGGAYTLATSPCALSGGTRSAPHRQRRHPGHPEGCRYGTGGCRKAERRCA